MRREKQCFALRRNCRDRPESSGSDRMSVKRRDMVLRTACWVAGLLAAGSLVIRMEETCIRYSNVHIPQ